MRKALTLIELLVAVSILAIGIVGVLRSFLSAQDALITAQNRLAAVKYLDSKMGDLMVKAIAENGIFQDLAEADTVYVGNRKAEYKLEIISREKFSDPPAGQEQPAIQEQPAQAKNLEKYNLAETKLSLAWQEGAKNKSEVLSSYLQVKEPAAGE